MEKSEKIKCQCVILALFVTDIMVEISGFSFSVPEFWLLIGFGTSFFIQFFYQVLTIIFTLSGKKKGRQENSPSISIIITSRNYEENLRILIPSILEQDYPDFEVVVVDDCSSDGSEWYLTELKLQSNKLKTSRILQETDFPNALAITIGIRAATKDWLVFLNPLCSIKGKDWLKSFAEVIRPETEAVLGFVTCNRLYEEIFQVREFRFIFALWISKLSWVTYAGNRYEHRL
jgi:poly-beta-1,6-N-acetyl-D-glucosamine synthase